MHTNLPKCNDILKITHLYISEFVTTSDYFLHSVHKIYILLKILRSLL